MEEPILDPKALEEALGNPLEPHLQYTPEATNNPRTRFYNRYQNRADEHDSGFVMKCGGDLDTTLIFAGLFSAVASAFILAVQTQLQPDYTQLSHDILRIFAESNGLKLPPRPDSDTPWTGPDPTLVRVQAILFSSLAVSLLAAFGAMLGKQWLTRYSRADMHGSLIDRSRDRQRKMDGMKIWYFDLTMEILPLMLQAALLLLGCALTSYLLTIDHLIAWVVGGFTASGFLYYVLIFFAATFSYDCPYQTPPSLIMHSIIRHGNRPGGYLTRGRRWLRRAVSRAKKPQTANGDGRHNSSTSAMPDGRTLDHIELRMWDQSDNLPTAFEKPSGEGFVWDSNCIAWMFKMSTDEDVIQDILKFIPEVVWHHGIQTTPLEKLYEILVDCLDRTSDRPVVIPKLRKKAYLAGKAFVHLAIQRKYIGDGTDKAVFDSISKSHARDIGLGFGYHEDSDLESTLGIVDRVLGASNPEPMRWKQFSFTGSHHAWMSHILLYRARYALQEGGPLPDDVRGFVLYSLQSRSSPPRIISVCLLIIGLVLGVNLDNNNQDIDNSRRLRSQINTIYQRLHETFQDRNSLAVDIDRAVEATRLVASLFEDNVPTKNYELFRVIMRAPVTPAYSEEKKWEASRLALRGAYQWDEDLPPVDDPQDILGFLNHHFESAAAGEDHDQPIEDAIRALAYASSDVTHQALEHFDPTEASFVGGICFAFTNERPLRLRKAALFFLPMIADRWFNAPTPITTADQTQGLSVDWASAVDEVGSDKNHIQGVALTVLLNMANSPHWRPFIVPEKWDLLRYCTLVPCDPRSLTRCLANPEILQALSDTGNGEAVALWSKILWLRYQTLNVEVQGKLEAITKVAQRRDFDLYLQTVSSRLATAERESLGFNSWSDNPRALALRAETDGLKEAQKKLTSLKRR